MLQYAKAIVAGVVAALTSISTGLVDGSLSAQDWVTAAIAGLVALSAVWAVPNKQPVQK